MTLTAGSEEAMQTGVVVRFMVVNKTDAPSWAELGSDVPVLAGTDRGDDAARPFP